MTRRYQRDDWRRDEDERSGQGGRSFRPGREQEDYRYSGSEEPRRAQFQDHNEDRWNRGERSFGPERDREHRSYNHYNQPYAGSGEPRWGERSQMEVAGAPRNWDSSQYGGPSYGGSQYGVPTYGSAQYGSSSQYGGSQYGASQYGASQYGAPQQDRYNRPGERSWHDEARFGSPGRDWNEWSRGDRAGQRVAWGAYEGSAFESRRSGGFSGKGPKNYTRSDDRIREDVCDRLSYDDEVDASDIIVTVQQGEVTLEGTVEDRRAKHRAEDIADSVNGVKDVHNRLRSRKGIIQEVGDRLMGREEEMMGHSGSGTRNAPAGTSSGAASSSSLRNGRV
ncbi:MAG TPA: BON domain-containing protein [Polyangiaceae bacterium]